MSVRGLRRGTAAGRGSAGTPTTYTIFGGTADGYISGIASGPDGDTSGSEVTTGDIFVGQNSNGVNAYEGFLVFDTSTAAGTITSVTLSLWGTNDSSVTDFTVEARIYDWGATLVDTDWRSRATLGTLTLVASYSTASWAIGSYNVFTSDAAFLSNINQAGSTRLIVCSSRHRNSDSVSGNEFVGFSSADEAGTTQDPKLVIEALV